MIHGIENKADYPPTRLMKRRIEINRLVIEKLTEEVDNGSNGWVSLKDLVWWMQHEAKGKKLITTHSLALLIRSAVESGLIERDVNMAGNGRESSYRLVVE